MIFLLLLTVLWLCVYEAYENSIFRFSAAIQNDKPRTLSNLIKKTAQEVSSPSSLNLNLATPQQDVLKKKWNEHKERLEG